MLAVNGGATETGTGQWIGRWADGRSLSRCVAYPIHKKYMYMYTSFYVYMYMYMYMYMSYMYMYMYRVAYPIHKIYDII